MAKRQSPWGIGATVVGSPGFQSLANNKFAILGIFNTPPPPPSIYKATYGVVKNTPNKGPFLSRHTQGIFSYPVRKLQHTWKSL